MKAVITRLSDVGRHECYEVELNGIRGLAYALPHLAEDAVNDLANCLLAWIKQ